MNRSRVIQCLIPLLFGIGAGIVIAWNVEIWVPVRDPVAKYLSGFGILAFCAATLIKYRTGYNWPWEGAAESSDPRPILGKRFLRNFALWIVIALLLLVGFTVWQYPGFR